MGHKLGNNKKAQDGYTRDRFLPKEKNKIGKIVGRGFSNGTG